jgi:primary-amine oxidase
MKTNRVRSSGAMCVGVHGAGAVRRGARAWTGALLFATALAGASGAVPSAFAQDTGAEASDKDLVPRGHCSPNNQTVTFSGVTTWDLCFSTIAPFGVVIQVAEFRRSPSDPFVRVLFDGRISEIFVPYHPGNPRFFDISNNNPPLLTLSAGDCPAPRTIIGNGKVCREIRDRGIAWKDDSLVRRGEELVLWSVADAGNYNYILEWAFRDDGSIAVRAGSTGPKLGGPNDTRGHMHAFSWRLDIDLGGANGDSVERTFHVEDLTQTPSPASDSTRLVMVEGGRPWEPGAFATLEIGDDTLQNGNGRPTSYELQPYRTGSGRHSEAFTKNDFWVTLANPAEVFAKNLPTYVNGQNVVSADVVVWYTGSAHHEDGMRDEDRDTVPVLWTGFELHPQNLFDRTPLYP